MKGKMYSNPPRKPMMYGGMSTKKGAQMGGMQTSADTNMPKNTKKKAPQGMNYQMAMTSAYPQQAGMMYGGKTENQPDHGGKFKSMKGAK